MFSPHLKRAPLEGPTGVGERQLSKETMPFIDNKKINDIDLRIATWMNKYGRLFLRYSLAIIFIWFGALKSLGMSPAADLVAQTVYWIDPEVFLPILGWWEMIIGVCLIFRPLIRAAIFLLLLQMVGTVMPLFILQEVCFTSIPFGLTLEGQYIVKNLIIISSALVIGGTVRSDFVTDSSIKV
jgi:uncharacterized membrane protein YkgB